MVIKNYFSTKYHFGTDKYQKDKKCIYQKIQKMVKYGIDKVCVFIL